MHTGGIFLKWRESGLNNGLMEAVTKLHHHQTQNYEYILIKYTTIFESSPQFLNEIIAFSYNRCITAGLHYIA
jgi:hypothetical protein